jgi:hypothetical protein
MNGWLRWCPKSVLNKRKAQGGVDHRRAFSTHSGTISAQPRRGGAANRSFVTTTWMSAAPAAADKNAKFKATLIQMRRFETDW